jgi:hypothetical protein
LKTNIVDKLLERCQGMFQWAALQIHQIRLGLQASNTRGCLCELFQFFFQEILDVGLIVACLNIVDKLLERCQGMFQWAALQIHQIRPCKTEESIWKSGSSNFPISLQTSLYASWRPSGRVSRRFQILSSRQPRVLDA